MNKFIELLMVITLNKFGRILTSREIGREAFAAFKSTLATLNDSETLEVDFSGVTTLSPSWADEFVGVLLVSYSDRLILKNTSNPSVKITLELIEKIHQLKFNITS
ncbi:MAG: STAS-like domain-containing protein [Candidatus Kerfeldbacteria bacterium]|nr:STAS-like domain-containing protein [Candidatus Kerfeldbacteria bacterium]